jgi:hypothetical protein
MTQEAKKRNRTFQQGGTSNSYIDIVDASSTMDDSNASHMFKFDVLANMKKPPYQRVEMKLLE